MVANVRSQQPTPIGFGVPQCPIPSGTQRVPFLSFWRRRLPTCTRARAPLFPRMTLHVVNPNTGAADYELSESSTAGVHAAAAKARQCAPAWRALSVEQRGEQLEKLAAGLEQAHDKLVHALREDTGSSVGSAEVFGVVALLRNWAKGLGRELVEDSVRASGSRKGYLVRTRYRPYELVGALAPWNVPLLLSFIDIVPALMAGCAVLVKPSEVTPRFVEPLLQVVKEVGGELAGVLEVVVGGAETGGAVVDSVDVVCFTGGITVGKIVARRCAERMIPVYLELGGKDAVIVDESADLETASSAIAWGGMNNSGQNCFSIERVYVHERVHDEFVKMVSRKVWEVEERGLLGPMIVAKQGEVIRGQIGGALEKGAKVAVGGKVFVDSNGATRVQGTVVYNVNHDMEIMREETFGPVIAVMKIESVDEGVELANDSTFGLGGAVFALPKEKAMGIAENLQMGTVGINDVCTTIYVGDVEKTAFGMSGVGNASRMGKRSIARFVRTSAQVVKEDALQHNPIWFHQ